MLRATEAAETGLEIVPVISALFSSPPITFNMTITTNAEFNYLRKVLLYWNILFSLYFINIFAFNI